MIAMWAVPFEKRGRNRGLWLPRFRECGYESIPLSSVACRMWLRFLVVIEANDRAEADLQSQAIGPLFDTVLPLFSIRLFSRNPAHTRVSTQ